VDGDVNDIKIEQISLDEPFVIEADESSATISVDVDVDYVPIPPPARSQ
jgi:hypothetical protein